MEEGWHALGVGLWLLMLLALLLLRYFFILLLVLVPLRIFYMLRFALQQTAWSRAKFCLLLVSIMAVLLFDILSQPRMALWWFFLEAAFFFVKKRP